VREPEELRDPEEEPRETEDRPEELPDRGEIRPEDEPPERVDLDGPTLLPPYEGLRTPRFVNDPALAAPPSP
jgi:hypothetical protein